MPSAEGARSLDDQGPGGVSFGGGEVEDRFQAEAQPVAQVVVSLADGGGDPVAQARGGRVEGREEAGFFVGEVLIEGGARDTGPLDHVLDVGFAVAKLGGGP